MIDRDRRGAELHRLSEDVVEQLHPAEHSTEHIRLALMISVDGKSDPSTFGLSDFIQFSKFRKSSFSIRLYTAIKAAQSKTNKTATKRKSSTMCEQLYPVTESQPA